MRAVVSAVGCMPLFAAAPTKRQVLTSFQTCRADITAREYVPQYVFEIVKSVRGEVESDAGLTPAESGRALRREGDTQSARPKVECRDAAVARRALTIDLDMVGSHSEPYILPVVFDASPE